MIENTSLARIAKIVGAAIAVQLAFWLILVPTLVDPEVDRPEFLGIDGFSTAKIETPDASGLSKAKFAEGSPGQIVSKSGYYAVQTVFVIDSVPAEGLALLDNSGGDNSRHFVNGSLIYSPGSMAITEPTYHSLKEDIVQISPGNLTEGENTVTSIYAVGLPRDVQLLPPILGDYRAISDAFGWKAFLLTDFRLITAIITLVVALFAGLAATRARNRDLPLWLFLAAASWAAHSLFFQWATMPLHGATRGFLYAIVTMFLSLAWAIFSDAWSGRRLRWFRLAVWAVFLTGSAFSAYLLATGADNGSFSQVEKIVEWVGLALTAATVLRLAAHFVTDQTETRYWEAALLVLLASLMAFYLYVLLKGGLNKPYLTHTQPLILLSLAGAFFSRNFELFQSRKQLNSELEAQLLVRTDELEEAHEREKVLLRKKAHDDERRRIMRDMHDGMGSNLMSMLLAARRGKAEPGMVARGLQTVIDEMRLMIDSMDSVGESLGSALVLFRERAQSRVTDAGFTFDWHDNAKGEVPELSPRTALQIFRILQEAITNALKHSDGNAISVTVEPHSICVTDNGTSFVGPRAGGRGLENMAARAQSIGGKFSISNADGNTVATIDLPDHG
ncbi:ATP-binding protein [Altererythrobacter sp. ZODW24]|uniref:sensor histidine kinase n=1 Tax=Altererythrobacter sp. ZODW24 TaxID=2185142 RepID=UPI000DF732A3|nr:ATP-binding protein [Altererythrobacter sp. ZODW24]